VAPLRRGIAVVFALAVGACDGASSSQYEEAADRVDELESENRQLREALEEANEQIRQAQAQLEVVKEATSCRDLRDAAEGMEDVEEVSEP